MRTIIFGLALCCFPLPLEGQHLPLVKDTAYIPFKVVDSPKGAIVEYVAPERATSGSIHIHALSIIDAGLQITYSLEKPEKGFSYDISISIRGEDGGSTSPQTWAVKGGHKNIDKAFDRREITWANALENTLDFNRQYTLRAIARLYGDLAQLGVSCEERPAFTYREQMPNYFGLLTGAGLIVAGQVYKGNADEDYEKYTTRWRQGGSEEAAAPFLDAAQKKDDTYKVLTVTGIAVLGIDAASYAFRYFKHRKKLKRYQKYCPQKKAPDRSSPAFQFSVAPEGKGLRAIVRF